MKLKRRRLSEEEKSRIVEGYEKSGESQTEYARRVGIGLSTLSLWCRRFARRIKPRLMEVDVAYGSVSGGSKGYRLTLAGGIALEFGKGFDVGELGLLLSTLRETN